jgi:hypothetical protein
VSTEGFCFVPKGSEGTSNVGYISPHAGRDIRSPRIGLAHDQCDSGLREIMPFPQALNLAQMPRTYLLIFGPPVSL